MAKKWFYKKRVWVLILLLIGWWICSRSTTLKMRYHPSEFSKEIKNASSLPFQFQQKQLDGTTLQYGQLGTDTQLPIVVLVHGSPGSLSAYKKYLKDSLLYQQAILIAIDRLGFGYSDFGTAVPSLQLQAQLIAAVLEDFPTSKKIIVGHSMGGPVNARLAMDYPHLVDGMILVAPSISPELEPSNWWRKGVDFMPLRWLTPPAFRVCNQEIIPLREELKNIEDRWADIKCPVTIIHGTEDPLVPAGNAYFAEKKLVNSASVELKMIKGGDHFILWSEIPLIRGAILDMLQQVQ